VVVERSGIRALPGRLQRALPALRRRSECRGLRLPAGDRPSLGCAADRPPRFRTAV